MMKPLYKQPLVEAVILASGILCTVVLIHGVQNFIALGGKPVTSQIAQKSNPDLVNVSAESFPLGDTCNRPGACSANNYSSDDPPVINPGSVPEAYDLDKYAMNEPVSGTHKVSAEGFQQSEVDGAGADMYPKLCTMFGNTFPVNFTKAEKHRSNASDNNTPSADGANVFEFTLPAGTPITVPVSGRNILHGLDSAGDGPEGMIMYATADRFAFQIGRKDFLKNIWIYVMDVDVDRALVAAYDAANAAGRDKLPEVSTGQILATSRGKVRIGVRDVGKLLDLRHIYPWDPGFVSSLGITKRCTQDTSVAAAGVPPGGGPILPAEDVSIKDISDSIILNNVQAKHKDFLRKDDKSVVVMGDSNTADKPFSIPEVTIENRSAGFQGANWLKANSGGLPKNSRFALILIGVNEVHNGNDKPVEGSINDFKANLQAAVEIILAQKIIPVLQEVNDFNNKKQGGLLENLKVVNDAIASVAETNNIPLIKTPYVKASHMKEDGYHFNDAGIALRNQILGVVNTKLTELAGGAVAGPKLIDGRVCKADSDCLSNKCGMPAGAKIPDPICLPDTPAAGGTVSGKIKLNGPGTYFIDIYQTDSETNFNRTDYDIVTYGLDPTDQVQWSFVPKNPTTCIFARMWTKTKDTTGEILPEKWVNSEIKCGLKPGDKDVILTINGPAAEKYTISGTITLTGGTLSGKDYVVMLSLYNPINDTHGDNPIHTQRIVTKANIGYTIPSRYAGLYTSQAILYEPDGTTKLYEEYDKYDLKTNISRDIPLVVPEDKTLPKYAITIKASKPTTAACPTATSPTISAYCLLGKVFNEQKGTVKLTIKDKAASNEKYRKYEGTIELGGGLRSNVMGIDIFEVSSASPISAGQVQSAQVGDNSIVFDPRLLDIKVTP